MLDRHERVRQRIRLTHDERVQEMAEDALSRGLKMALNVLNRLKKDTKEVEAIISEKFVDVCAVNKVDVTSLTGKITAAEKVRTDKIKEEEDKIKPQGGQHEIR